jgi:hypothetical protein
MKINDPVWFKDSPCSNELADRQSAAVGDSLGVVVGIETRDGVEYANVLFATYGATFTGVLVADLEPMNPDAPKSLFGRVKAVFGG